ncbi:flippase-like domain-containing protein [Streptomyces sp. ISL-22]|uniref:lysylphosphatidylglycerol synthase domain-containing protein n=1 Tax=unclassified Streptomyces TaxID=2593676 RepID=UPI001BE882D8|nr:MULTISPECIES: lysylphosphatidylglycerol synthase domain-containing protein [unclassified Streptomyces]MBT2419400.1 flippase-like domain-containing protein [Streptomyces sp. ISL-24]MBT2436896.1 flippase-like domain-containing protein [Streptomyces sp. ISL-22]
MTSEQTLATPPRRRACWHLALTLACLSAVVWVARRHWPVLETGAVRLAVADQGWLLVAAAATLATWPCAALAQQGAVPRALPPGRLVAAQFAASAAHHMLPAGLGAGAVNLRFLIRCGIPIAGAATAIAVKGTAGVIVRGALIAVLVVLCPGVLHVPRVGGGFLVALCAVAAGAVALLAGPLWARSRKALAALWAYLGAVHARPARAAALWGGSLTFVALHCLVLIAVTRAVALPLAPVRVALLYLAASGAAALLPTPGGLGSLDAVLALALTAVGAPAVAAASAVLGYRLLTAWLPLIPGLLVLGLLIRRRAL